MSAISEFNHYLGEGFQLKNRFFIVRHGLAESNVKQVLVTKPEVGTNGWGLVAEGKEQAKKAGERLKEMIDSEKEVVVITSDFMRTRQTAELIHETLKVKTPLRFDVGLRERNMGDLDLMEVRRDMFPNLFDLWKDDENDALVAKYNAESVATVASRMSSVIKAVNGELDGAVVVLVSHQDPLHIIYSLFVGRPLAQHKLQSPPIGNCDIRELSTD